MDDKARRAGITYANQHREKIRRMLINKGNMETDEINYAAKHAYKNYREGFIAATTWHETHLNVLLFERILELNKIASERGIFPEHRANWMIKNFEKFYNEA